MNLRTPAALAACLALCLADGTARAACKLSKADLPVTISGLRALIAVQVNGTPEDLIIDSGASFSVITDQKASELKLPLTPPPPNLEFGGIGGIANIHVAKVHELKVAGATTRSVEFITEGTDFVTAAGLLGENFLGAIGDVEYDLANGAVRLFRPEGCGRNMLAYWVKPDQPLSIIGIDSLPGDLLIRGTAYLNGVKINVVFDTGADTSILSLRAAARAGVKPGDPGVEAAGYNFGVGRRRLENWIAHFDSFKIGDEEIRNTRLRFGDIGAISDMLLGFDFFLSHRVFVAKSQGKLYFTYNGGPVFNLTPQPRPKTLTADAQNAPGNPAAAQNPPGAAPPPAGGPPAAASASTAAQPDTAEPADAAGYARRAAILLTRHDYDGAIADLTRAIEQDPSQPLYFRDRVQAYLGKHQVQLARADLDHYLTLKPDDAGALIERAQAHLAAHEQPGAIADLDAASHAVSKEDGVRLQIGQLYQNAEMAAPAIEQFDLWLASHDDDPNFAQGLFLRCRARALEGQQLDKALSDCSANLRRVSGPASVAGLETRGLVRLRRGELDKSIEDYTAALKLAPRNVGALYGRGLAKLRKGAAADGQADLAAARAVMPGVDAAFKKLGLTP